MPNPGEPYIPKIAWPSRLRVLNSFWKDCDGVKWFTGYDPPRVLTPVAAMAPTITPDLTSHPAQTPHGFHYSHSEGRTAVPAATPSPDQPAITVSPRIPKSRTAIDPQADPHAASSESSVEPPESRVRSANPASQSQEVDDAKTSKDTLTGPRHPQGSHSQSGPRGGAIDPSSVVPQVHPLQTQSGRLQVPSTAKPQIDPDNGSQLSQQPESLENPKSEQQRKTTEASFSQKSKSVVAALRTHVKPSIVHHTYNQEPSSPKIIETDGQALTFTAGNLMYHGSTIRPGDSPTRISGTFISFGREGHLKMGTKTIHILPTEMTTQPSAGLPGGSSVRTLANGVRVFQGATLTPGAPAVSALEMTMSLDKSDNLIVASQAKSSSTAPNADQPPTTVIAGQTIAPPPQAGIALSESALGESNPRIPPGVSSLDVGSKTIPFLAAAGPPSLTWPVIAGQTITPLSNAVAIAGTTLKPEDPAATISGAVISLNPTALIVNSNTIPFPPTPAGSIPTVIAGQALTAVPGEVLVDNATVIPGGAGLTISGTRVSVDSQGEVIVGTHVASASQIRAVITETASVSSGSQPRNDITGLNAFEGRAGKVEKRYIASLVAAMMGIMALNVIWVDY